MSAPTYQREVELAELEQDRQDERRRDYYDALGAAREQDAVTCTYCGEEVVDEADAEDAIHFACQQQLDALAEIKKVAQKSCQKLTDVLSEYAWARQFGSAKQAPEKPADALYAKRIGYLASALDAKTNREHLLNVVKLLLWTLHDEARLAQPKNAAHASTSATPTMHRISTALVALEQVRPE